MTTAVPLRFAVRLAWVVVLVVVVTANASNRVAALPLALVAAGAWLAWATARRPAAAIVVLAAAGAVLCIWSTIALGFVAMAGIAAGTTFELRRAAALALVGPAALAVALAAAGWSTGVAVGGAAGALAGLLGGVSRRQTRQAEAQASRAHLARELHDVLAHTLAALSVQLEAAEAVFEAGDERRLGELLQRSKRLVADGIDEAAQAVQALRDEPVEIADRLARLVAGEPVSFRVAGTPRALPPGPGLALYRAAQEALTNARKHAPGAATNVVLSFLDGATIVRVDNGPPPTPTPAGPGSGHGLQGMRERLELAGGRLEAHAAGAGFVVEAEVPS